MILWIEEKGKWKERRKLSGGFQNVTNTRKTFKLIEMSLSNIIHIRLQTK